LPSAASALDDRNLDDRHVGEAMLPLRAVRRAQPITQARDEALRARRGAAYERDEVVPLIGAG
jgi:hypothetical protein